MKKFIAIAAGLALALAAMAQPAGAGMPPQGGRPSFGSMPQGERPHREMGNPAKVKAERMQQELVLTDKQYKKVLKVYKQEENALHPNMNSGGMPGGFGGPGMGGPGGGPGMGGPGGPGGGRGMGGPGGGDFGDRPMGPPPGMEELSADEMEKIIDKKEKKLRKILTPEQFDRWASTHPEEFRVAMPEWK